MKKRSYNKTTEKLMEISMTKLSLSEWFNVIGFVFLTILLYLLRFLNKYILKALDLIVTLFIAFLIIYIFFHPAIKITLDLSGK